MAICEALIARVPVVISEACHFPEVARSGAGIVVPLSSRHIADGMSKCITDKQWAMMAADAAYNMMTRSYSWKNIAADMLSAYAM